MVLDRLAPCSASAAGGRGGPSSAPGSRRCACPAPWRSRARPRSAGAPGSRSRSSSSRSAAARPSTAACRSLARRARRAWDRHSVASVFSHCAACLALRQPRSLALDQRLGRGLERQYLRRSSRGLDLGCPSRGQGVDLLDLERAPVLERHPRAPRPARPRDRVRGPCRGARPCAGSGAPRSGRRSGLTSSERPRTVPSMCRPAGAVFTVRSVSLTMSRATATVTTFVHGLAWMGMDGNGQPGRLEARKSRVSDDCGLMRTLIL